MGRKKKEKGFWRFNRWRLIGAVMAAILLTAHAAYKIDHIESYNLIWEIDKAVELANVNYLASVFCNDESFIDEAQSVPIAFDYVNFQVLNKKETPIEVYLTDYSHKDPGQEGAKAVYNTLYMLSQKVYFIPDSIVEPFLNKPDYDTKPAVWPDKHFNNTGTYLESETESYHGLPPCRATNSLYAEGAGFIKAYNTVEEDYPNDHMWYYSGTLEVKGYLFRYEYIATYKDYLETSTVLIVCLFLLLLILCFTASCLIGLRKYHIYIAELRNISFKNGLIDALAHNLKTPMQIITLNAENLKDRHSPDRRKHYTDAIISRAKVMNDMTVSVNQATHSNPVITTFSAKEAVMEAAARLDADLKIIDDIKIKADKDNFIQAVYNLIDNAVSYSPEGSVITVENKPRKMIISNPARLDKFTPGTGIAIADRFLTKNGMLLTLELKDGVFKAVIEFGFY